MHTVVRTHVGRVRPDNQDSYLVVDGEHPFLMVADGMGGHKGGQVASRMAAEGMQKLIAGKKPDAALLTACIEAVNRDIFAKQLTDENLSGMGTTLTCLWKDGDRFLMGHVGDSRVYLCRKGAVYQMSNDHSLVGELLRAGHLTPEMADDYPYRNVITKAVGTDKQIVPDISYLACEAGDRWLICSDGLTEYVKQGDLVRDLSEQDMERSADTMIQKALERGGRDNITFLVAEVGE